MESKDRILDREKRRESKRKIAESKRGWNEDGDGSGGADVERGTRARRGRRMAYKFANSIYLSRGVA